MEPDALEFLEFEVEGREVDVERLPDMRLLKLPISETLPKGDAT